MTRNTIHTVLGVVIGLAVAAMMGHAERAHADQVTRLERAADRIAAALEESNRIARGRR